MLSCELISFTHMQFADIAQSDLTRFALLRFGGFSRHFLNLQNNLVREFSYLQDAKHMQAFCQLFVPFCCTVFEQQRKRLRYFIFIIPEEDNVLPG